MGPNTHHVAELGSLKLIPDSSTYWLYDLKQVFKLSGHIFSHL